MATLAGKLYLVTGSTDGIGLQTACRLATAGADVLVHGRNPSRLEAAVQRVQRAAAGNSQHVRGHVADLSSLADVRRLAEEVRSGSGPQRLAGVINNAGVFEQQRRLSADGLEMTWAVNVAAPFLLTALLLDAVDGRLVNISSISAASSIDWENLQQERGFSSHAAYSLSKLASMLFTFQLARRLEAAGSGVTCNCLDPGTVNTKMLVAGWGSCGMRLQDADDEFNAATDPALERVSGNYFVESRQRQAPGIAYDEAAQARLWKVLEAQTQASWSV